MTQEGAEACKSGGRVICGQHVGLGTELGPLQMQQGLLTAEPFLQPRVLIFSNCCIVKSCLTMVNTEVSMK